MFIFFQNDSNSGFNSSSLHFLPIKLTPEAQHFKIWDHYIILSMDARTISAPFLILLHSWGNTSVFEHVFQKEWVLVLSHEVHLSPHLCHIHPYPNTPFTAQHIFTSEHMCIYCGLAWYKRIYSLCFLAGTGKHPPMKFITWNESGVTFFEAEARS